MQKRSSLPYDKGVITISRVWGASLLYALSGLGLAASTDPSYLVSEQAQSCLKRAQLDAQSGQPRAALARLESILLTKPLSVGVAYETIPSGGKGFVDGVKQAVAEWAKHLPEPTFTFVDSDRSDITVRFVESVPGKEDLQGFIEARYEYNWTESSHSCRISASLYVSSKCERRLLTKSEVAQIVTHELGHLLGLSDSNEERRLMGPFNPAEPCLSPTTEELSAVRQFRGKVLAEMDRIRRALSYRRAESASRSLATSPSVL